MTIATSTLSQTKTSPFQASNPQRYQRRLWVNRFNLTMSWLCMAFGLFWLIWILYTLFSEGLSGLNMAVFTQDTPAPNMEGGLRNALLGSLMLTVSGLFIGTPIGILCGIFLAEFGRQSKIASVIRFINDILLSAPSIVIGLFVFELIVAQQGHFSGWAGSVALSLLVIPVVVRTTENMLALVPNSLREAAYALGTPKWRLVTMVTLKAAKAGVMTGVLLAFARIAGETAPLLFTALNNNFFSTDMNAPIANLPNVIFQFAMSPYENWRSLAWTAALIITLTVLFINILARWLSSKSH
ncbi:MULTISPECIES: phosphate ABC transporter permease PstA [unclassified Acinetobacter]|uniref:phosphate ABC transporter permease PstA n=1 Tax=unclassified Acinetobacter TaxID=196816 RepID=UPI0035B739B9